jgi:hypothetical protein
MKYLLFSASTLALILAASAPADEKLKAIACRSVHQGLDDEG